MSIDFERREDWFLNRFQLNEISKVNDRVIRQIKDCKYLSCLSSEFNTIFEKFKLLKDSNVDLKDKTFIIDINHGFYLTTEQCTNLINIKNEIEACGAKFKIKDGNYWELEEVVAVSSKLDEVVSNINNATVEEDGVKRPLNEMEKFLWAYSFVANRKYRENEMDKDSSRSMTSIFQTGDCVCVGFAAILKELCSKLGIECYMNSCQVYDKNKKTTEGHHNNIVIINGTAFYCDACWDCVADGRRPRRTFSTCLTSFEERKDSLNTSISDVTAPFCDIKADLEDINNKLKEVESMESFNKDDFTNFTAYGNSIDRYKNLIPKYETTLPPFTVFKERNYKEEAIYYYTKAKELIEQRQIKQPYTTEDFEKALTNLYKSMGNSEKKAQEKARLDIEASIAEAGLSYLNTSKNCFAQEYYRQLEV